MLPLTPRSGWAPLPWWVSSFSQPGLLPEVEREWVADGEASTEQQRGVARDSAQGEEIGLEGSVECSHGIPAPEEFR